MVVQQLIMGYANTDAPLSSAGMIASLVCLVWVGSAAAWMSHALMRRRRHRIRFNALAAERGFNPEAARDLWVLSAHSGSADRAVILTSAQVFDSCVEEARAAAGDDLVAWPEHLSASRITTLRKRYETVRKARGRITSTYEMELNQPVSIQLEDGRAFNSFVLRVADDKLHMAAPGQDDMRRKLMLCKSFTATFTRPNDARYEFSSQLVGNHHVSPMEFLGTHADVKRTQARASARVRCKSETHFCLTDRHTAETSAEMRTWKLPRFDCVATLRDLSLGGACFVSQSPLARNTWLLVKVPGSGEDEALILPAQVVRNNELNGTSNAHVQTCVRFGPLTARQENRLARLVADLQQQLIRRMLSRAGAPEQKAPLPMPAPAPRVPVDTAMSRQSDRDRDAHADSKIAQDVAPRRAPVMQDA